MPTVPFLGFAPDYDPLTPGVLTDCAGIMPTKRGFTPKLSPMPQYPALASPALGEAFLAQYLNGTTRLFVGTATHLYELTSGTTITEVDGGTTFTGGAWRFAMFGNDCIATNLTDVPQVAGSSGNFSALGGTPPKAQIVETVYGFTLLFETDNWHCSKLGVDSVWSNSVADLSATGQLLDTPGSITAARKLNRAMIAYKSAGVYIGQFVDVPVIWDWNLIDPTAGCAGQGSVVNIGKFHAFIGLDDFYMTDGNSVWPITGPDGKPNPIKEWFFETLAPGYGGNIEGILDVTNENVNWFFPSTSASTQGTRDQVITWNYRNNKWTHDKVSIQAVVRPYFQGTTSWSYDKFDTTYGTYNGIPDIPYDSALFFGSSQGYLSYVDTNNIVQALTGPAMASMLQTGDYGDNRNFIYLNGVRPMFATNAYPAETMTITDLHRRASGTTFTTGDVGLLDQYGYVSVRGSDGFHRLLMNLTGNYEIIGIQPDLSPDGEL